jgi:hypothetical protein
MFDLEFRHREAMRNFSGGHRRGGADTEDFRIVLQRGNAKVFWGPQQRPHNNRTKPGAGALFPTAASSSKIVRVFRLVRGFLKATPSGNETANHAKYANKHRISGSAGLPAVPSVQWASGRCRSRKLSRVCSPTPSQPGGGWLGVDEQVPLGCLFQMKGLAPVHAHEHLLGKEKGL